MFLLFHLRLSRQPERVSEEDGSWNAATAKKSGKKDDIKNQCAVCIHVVPKWRPQVQRTSRTSTKGLYIYIQSNMNPAPERTAEWSANWFGDNIFDIAKFHKCTRAGKLLTSEQTYRMY